MMTAGNSDGVQTGWSGAVRGRHKLCEIRPSCDGGHGGLYRTFTDISISRVRPGPWLHFAMKREEQRQTGDRGEIPLWKVDAEEEA